MWGKILGTLFGFLLTGNFVGAIIGLLIGNLFDRGLRQHWRTTSWLNNNEQQHQIRQVFFRISFLVMGHVAKADGRITEQDIHMARKVMRRMNLTPAQQKQAILLFNKGKQTDFNLSKALSDLMASCGHHHLLLKMFVDIQYQAATANGVINSNQQKILAIIARRLGFAPFAHGFNHQYNNTRGHYSRGSARPQQPKTSLSDAYSLLGINQNASEREIKRAYRKQMSQNHPDKLIAQGLPEEMIKLATDKTQKIRAAYEQIREARNL